jgi:hypothetical protein
MDGSHYGPRRVGPIGRRRPAGDRHGDAMPPSPLLEAGGGVRHPDGREYDVRDASDPTLCAPTPAAWGRAYADLFGAEGSGP